MMIYFIIGLIYIGIFSAILFLNLKTSKLLKKENQRRSLLTSNELEEVLYEDLMDRQW